MSNGYKHTEEAKQKIAAAKRGRKLTDQHKRAMSDGMKAYWAVIKTKIDK